MARPKSVSDREVLEGAARVIGRKGPVAFTIREVADEVGLAPATILQRFRTKRGLLLALERDAHTALAEAFDGAAREAASPRAAVVLGLQRSVAGFRSAREMANHLAFLALDLNDPELWRGTKAYFALLRGRVADLLQQEAAARRGGAMPRAEADRLAVLVEVAFNGALTTWAIEQDGRLDDLLTSSVDAVLPPA